MSLRKARPLHPILCRAGRLTLLALVEVGAVGGAETPTVGARQRLTIEPRLDDLGLGDFQARIRATLLCSCNASRFRGHVRFLVA